MFHSRLTNGRPPFHATRQPEAILAASRKSDSRARREPEAKQTNTNSSYTPLPPEDQSAEERKAFLQGMGAYTSGDAYHVAYAKASHRGLSTGSTAYHAFLSGFFQALKDRNAATGQ